MYAKPHIPDQFDWNALQSFLAVVRCGRLTAAARRLGVDHSTLSRRIADLEDALQVQLFDRQPTGYTLTSPGEALLELAQTMEGVAVKILTDIAGSRLKVAGTVRVGAPNGFGTSCFLVPLLGRLGQDHPDLRIELVTLPRIFSLSKREADIAIGLAPPAEGRLHSRKLTDYELGVYASHHYCETNSPILSVADLKKHQFIGYIEDLIYAPELDYIPLISREIQPFLTSSNLLAQLDATAQGFGLCILPCFMADMEPSLKRVLKTEVALIRSFYMIVHSDTRSLARIQVITNFIAHEVKAARTLFLPV